MMSDNLPPILVINNGSSSLKFSVLDPKAELLLSSDLLIDGPLQYDDAFMPDVAKTKAPNSPVAERATIFIFPDSGRRGVDGLHG